MSIKMKWCGKTWRIVEKLWIYQRFQTFLNHFAPELSTASIRSDRTADMFKNINLKVIVKLYTKILVFNIAKMLKYINKKNWENFNFLHFLGIYEFDFHKNYTNSKSLTFGCTFLLRAVNMSRNITISCTFFTRSVDLL